MKKIKLVLFLFLLIQSKCLYSSIYEYYPNPLGPSSSNYGITGVLQNPNARFMEEGSMKIGVSNSFPNKYTYITATPFNWLEASYKYTEMKNLLYGPKTFSGNQTLKDKGFDLKIRLFNESYLFPEVSIGWNDLAGTGLLSSEYIVATKNIKNFDFTLGLGWGALGQDKNLRNPFISIDERFRTRELDSKEGGTFNSNTWFSGEKISLFSALEYYAWKRGLVFKLEYDTSNPDLGYFGPRIDVKSRFNLGIDRPINENLNIGFSFERGDELRLYFSLKGNYGKKPLVQKKDPPNNVVSLNRQQKKIISENKEIFYRSLNRGLREESVLIQSAELQDKEVEIVIAQNKFRSFPRAIGRSARIVTALLPEAVESIKVIPMNGDVQLYEVKLNKTDLDKLYGEEISKSEMLYKTSFNSAKPKSYLNNDFQPKINFPEVFLNMSPSLRHQIGGPEAFYLGQVWWKINAKVKFTRGLTLHSVIGLDLYNNFDEFSNPSSSTIPRVRSDIQEYLSQGKNNIARLKIDYIWSPYQDFFAKLDIGYLEEMFGGFGGEIYYRPFFSDFSTSFSIHKVKQRNYDQKFGFRDYETITGHIGLYYNFPKGVQLQALAGKYLAGDNGITLDLSRRFRNGFTLGIFATKTNLSAEEFGEGSFDKGFYFSIPTESFFTDFRQGDISFGLHPLTKDGGALLNHLNPLFSLYGDTQYSSLIRDWRDIDD